MLSRSEGEGQRRQSNQDLGLSSSHGRITVGSKDIVRHLICEQHKKKAYTFDKFRQIIGVKNQKRSEVQAAIDTASSYMETTFGFKIVSNRSETTNNKEKYIIVNVLEDFSKITTPEGAPQHIAFLGIVLGLILINDSKILVSQLKQILNKVNLQWDSRSYGFDKPPSELLAEYIEHDYFIKTQEADLSMQDEYWLSWGIRADYEVRNKEDLINFIATFMHTDPAPWLKSYRLLQQRM